MYSALVNRPPHRNDLWFSPPARGGEGCLLPHKPYTGMCLSGRDFATPYLERTHKGFLEGGVMVKTHGNFRRHGYPVDFCSEAAQKCGFSCK